MEMKCNKKSSKLHFKVLNRLLVFILCLRRTVCFASSSSPTPRLPYENDEFQNGKNIDQQPEPIRIESLNKYGGAVKFFDLVLKENGNQQKNRAIRSIIRNPSFAVTALNRKLVPALRTTFLPIGFPDKTPHGYFQFCIWSWIQDVSTQLRSVLATQKILEGVGVGREGATALSALFNFLVRDGCGMAANLLFTYAASSRFRTDVKRWRIFADMSVDIGITLEVAAIFFPKPFFLPLICLGNMFKALCGVAAGACGGSINLYWAEGSDISDINAKFGAQHTVTGAIGLVFAGLFAKSVSQIRSQSLWLMYFILTYLHLYGNVKCMRLISFDYPNTIRLEMLLRDYIVGKDDSLAKIQTPQHIAQKEPLWFMIQKFRRFLTRRKKVPSIYFGVAYDEFCKRSRKPLEVLKSDLIDTESRDNGHSKSNADTEPESLDDGYIITTGHENVSQSGKTQSSKPCVAVSFFTGVSSEQQAKAYAHAWLLANLLQERLEKEAQSNNPFVMDCKRQLEIEAEAKILLKSMWGKFHRTCTHAGWNLSRSELQTQGYEIKVVNRKE